MENSPRAKKGVYLIKSYITCLYLATVLLFSTTEIRAEAVVATIPVGTNPLTIVVDSATNKIYVANYASNTVTIIDGFTNKTSTVPAGSYPSAIAINPATHKVYVANEGSNNVTVIDGSTNSTTTIKTDSFPNAIAVNSVTNKIYVANGHERNSNLTVINGATNATVSVPVAQSPNWSPDPLHLAVNPVTDKVYFGCTDTNFISVLDGATNQTKNIVVGTLIEHTGVCDIGINIKTNKIYVACADDRIVMIDGATGDTATIIRGLSYSNGFSRIAVNPVTNMIYVTMSTSAPYGIHVFKINGITNDTSSVTTYTGSNGPIAVNPTTNKIYALLGGGIASIPLSIKIINGATDAVTSLPVGSVLYSIAINPASGLIYAVHPTDNNVSVINGNAPSAVTLVSPSGNAPDVVLTPTMKWDSLSFSGSRYTVQVTTDNLFSTMIINDTTSADSLFSKVSLAVGTKYYWRVGATNSNGSGPWVTDSFTTAILIPSPPAMILPANGATGVAPDAKLIWNRSYGAETYRVQFSTSSTLIIQTDTSTTDTLLSVSLAPLATFYWRVCASNRYGTGTWSAFDSFFTPPLPPTIVSPAAGDSNVALNSRFSWHGSAGAETYRVQISNNATFQSVFDTIIIDTFLTDAPLLPNLTWYWRVSSGIAKYGFSPWSPITGFTAVIGMPSVPVPILPQDGAFFPYLPVKLEWDKCPGAATYNVQVSTSIDFISGMDTTITAPYLAITGLTSRTTYYWRVKAQNVIGTSNWSVVRRFSTTRKVGVQLPATVPGRMPGAGTLSVYSLDGRLVMQISVTALDVKAELFKSAQENFARGIYYYCLMQGTSVMDKGRFVTK